MLNWFIAMVLLQILDLISGFKLDFREKTVIE